MATSYVKEQNGVFAQFVHEDGKVHRRLFDPVRNARLSALSEIRKAGGSRMMSWGKQIAEIPEADMPVLRGLFGEALFNPKFNKWDRRVARERFLKSAASDPYRVEYRKRTIS